MKKKRGLKDKEKKRLKGQPKICVFLMNCGITSVVGIIKTFFSVCVMVGTHFVRGNFFGLGGGRGMGIW